MNSKTKIKTTKKTKQAVSGREGWSRQQVEFYEAMQGLSLLQVMSVKYMTRMLLCKQNGDLKGAIDNCLWATWACPNMAAVNIHMLAGLKVGDFDAPKKVRSRE